MSSERRIAYAIKIVGQEFGRNGRPPHGTESNATIANNVNTMRALEGLCGHCNHVEIGIGHRHGKEVVALGCAKGQFPLAVYENTPFWEEAFCRQFSKRGVLKYSQ